MLGVEVLTLSCLFYCSTCRDTLHHIPELFVLDTLYYKCDKFVCLQKASFHFSCVHFYCASQTHNYNQANKATISIQSGLAFYKDC